MKGSTVHSGRTLFFWELEKIMNSLRQIGTEFEIDFGVDPFSTEPRGRRKKYRIVDHVLVKGLDGKDQYAEKIGEVSIEYYEIDPAKYIWVFTYAGN